MATHWPDPTVFLAWELRVERIEAVRDAYRVITPRGQFCLKRASGDGIRLTVIAEALDYLTRRGFHQVTPFFPTREGKAFCQHGEACYYLTEWLPGERPDLSNPALAVPACECLAGFHRAAEGFSGRGVIRDHLGTWPERLGERLLELRALQADRALELYPDAFTKAFLDSVERWLGLGEWSMELLSAAGYAEEVAAFRERRGLCHGDPAERNLIWWQGQPFLIDFDTLLVDLPVLDLARLVRRVDQDHEWDLDLAARMLAGYASVRPLNDREKALLVALLAFPEKYWRAVHRYYRNREGKSRRHLIHRLQEVEANWGPINRFLPAMAGHLDVRLPRPLP